LIEKILLPETLEEATDSLLRYGPDACLHAGGTDVVPRLQAGKLACRILVDLGRIPELRTIEILPGGAVLIGSMVSLTRCAEAVETAGFTALRQAALSVGSVQIRNRATLAGNVCNASPGADTLPALAVMGAEVLTRKGGNERTVPLGEFITGPGQTCLEPGEIVRGILLPSAWHPVSSAFLRLSRRRAVDLASISAACGMDSRGGVRFSLGSVNPRPGRVENLETLVETRGAEEAFTALKKDPDLMGIRPISDIRAGADYRKAMAAVLLERVYRAAAKGGIREN